MSNYTADGSIEQTNWNTEGPIVEGLEHSIPDWDPEEVEDDHQAEEEIKVLGPQFVIDSNDKADWFLAKVAAWNTEELLLIEQHNKRLAAIKRDRLNFLKRFDTEFSRFVEGQIAQMKGKTLTLPHGDVTLRKVRASLSVADESAARAYIEGREADWAERLLVHTTTIDKEEYVRYAKRCLKEDAERLPGILVKPEYEKLSYWGRDQFLKATAKEEDVDA